jgi:hypothetical protein
MSNTEDTLFMFIAAVVIIWSIASASGFDLVHCIGKAVNFWANSGALGLVFWLPFTVLFYFASLIQGTVIYILSSLFWGIISSLKNAIGGLVEGVIQLPFIIWRELKAAIVLFWTEMTREPTPAEKAAEEARKKKQEEDAKAQAEERARKAAAAEKARLIYEKEKAIKIAEAEEARKKAQEQAIKNAKIEADRRAMAELERIEKEKREKEKAKAAKKEADRLAKI